MSALLLNGCTMESFGAVPSKDKGPRVVIGFRAPISERVVKALDLEWAFTGDSPRDPIAALPLKLDMVDMVLRMPAPGGGVDSYYPERVSKFFVERAADAAWLLFRVRFAAAESNTAKLQELLGVFFRYRSQTFDLTLDSRQGELFEEGTRVDMAPHAGDGESTVIEPVESEAAGPTLTSMTEAKRRGLAKGKGKNKGFEVM